MGAALLCLLLSACVDQPNPIPPPGSTTPVTRLSELHIFDGDPALQRPATGFVPYDVNVPLYSDGAHKRRFALVPEGEKIHVTDTWWELPVGAYLVKTFYYPRDERDPSLGEQLIETRFLVRDASGLRASTYVWNQAQTDAFVSGGNLDVPFSFIDASGAQHDDSFHVPGTSQCQTCHEDRALGLRIPQMDKAIAFDGGTTNQIDHLFESGLIDMAPAARDPLPDPFGNAPLDARARSYLDANCGHCHATTGSAAGTKVYWDRASTAGSTLPVCRPTDSVDGRDRVLVPGHPERSEFLARMTSSDASVRMPRGPSHIPDTAGIALLSSWVAAMDPVECP